MRKPPFDPARAGAITLVVAVVVVWLLAFGVPFTGGPDRRVEAVVSHVAGLTPGAPVRVAGVDVGRVGALRAGPDDDTVLVLELDEHAPAVREDAALEVRPRLLLEGGFFVDLRPGSPAARELPDGARMPRERTAVAVQLDEVLSSLESDPRASLSALLRGFGGALSRRPNAEDDRDAAPETRGQDAASSLNDALADAPRALRDGAVGAQALRGRRDGDATRLVAGLERVAGGLAKRERQLGSLVDGLDRTTTALASERVALRTAVARLPRALRTTDRALRGVRRALPDVRAVARELVPGLRSTPATATAVRPLLTQLRSLNRRTELGGLAADLRPVARDLATTAPRAAGLLASLGRLSRCATRVLLPTGRVRLDDGPFSTGVENYKELLYGAVGFTGEGQGFDGNGTYVRFQTGGGPRPVSMAPGASGGDRLHGKASLPPLGTRPAYPGTATAPIDASGRCWTQAVPDLRAAPGPADGAGA